MTKKEKVGLILERLLRVYPAPVCALRFSNPWELLVATILSAQATDVSVNKATPFLFSRYKDIPSYASVHIDELSSYIRTINFYNNKAKYIIGSAKKILSDYHGIVPDRMDDLLKLPGVARKTANVVMGNGFGIASGIVVDTHVMRLSKKLGLTDKKNPVDIEKDLMVIVPREYWISFSHLLILHGRDICTARPHTCKGCPLGDICPEYGGIST